jgi:hypothetical protein
MLNLFIGFGFFRGLGLLEILLILGIVVPLALLVMVFFILTLQNALKRCAPQNRRMDPALVWLLLIPLFHYVWIFIVVNNIADSLAAEFRQRNIAAEPYPGRSIGLAYGILAVCSVIPFVGLVTGLPALICWIVYWVRISNYSSQLVMPYTM